MSSHDVQPLLEALKTVAVALKEEGVPFALAGGCAIYARGGADSRHDVDFVIMEKDAGAVRSALDRRDIRTYQPPEDWLFKVDDHGEQVDVIFRLASGPVDEDLIGRSDQLTVDSVRMPVMSAGDILVSKLWALTEHHCDLSPVLALVRSLREQIDVPFVEDACRGNPFAEAALGLARRLGTLSDDGGPPLGADARGALADEPDHRPDRVPTHSQEER